MRGREGQGFVFLSLQLRIPQLSTLIERKDTTRESPNQGDGPRPLSDTPLAGLGPG